LIDEFMVLFHRREHNHFYKHYPDNLLRQERYHMDWRSKQVQSN